MSKMSDVHENDSTTSTKSLPLNVGVDVLGKVLVKAQFNEDIRRVPIHNEDITYDELVLMMQRVFRGQLKPDDDITIKYQDEDGDMVTIFDSAELSEVLTYCRVLKLKIIVKEKEPDEVALKLKNIGISEIRRELRELRDKATRILDVLDAEVENRHVLDKSNGSTVNEADIILESKVTKIHLNGSTGGYANENILGVQQQPSPLIQQQQLNQPGHASQPSQQQQQQHVSTVAASQHQPQQQPGQQQLASSNLQQQQHPQVPGQQQHVSSTPHMQHIGGPLSQQPPPSSSQQLPPASGQPPPSSGTQLQHTGGYPPSSTPTAFSSYSTGYPTQQYSMQQPPQQSGYPPTSASPYGRPGGPPPSSMPMTGVQSVPPPPTASSQQQTSQQPQQLHAQSPPQSFPGYQQQPNSNPMNMPPITAQPTDQPYGSAPPPPSGSSMYNQYRLPGSVGSGSSMFGHGRPPQGYK